MELYAQDAQDLLAALSQAYQAVAHVERVMHPTRSGSDLARIRSLPAGATTEVDPWTWYCLQQCQQLHQISGGAFDPCLPEAPGRCEDLELLADHEVRARRPLHLDLGGIAKGLAIDRAVAALIAGGCAAGLVNAGGDLRVFGERDFPVQCRKGPEQVQSLVLREQALAVSFSRPPNPPPEHRGYYDRREPPRTAMGCAAVLAPCALLADALTKWALLERGPRLERELQRLGAQLI